MPLLALSKMAKYVVAPPKDVWESLMNDGTIDAIRMKVISQSINVLYLQSENRSSLSRAAAAALSNSARAITSLFLYCSIASLGYLGLRLPPAPNPTQRSKIR